ncbi:hypothetical protein Tco_1304730 [Tanacetum coccineum]
MRYRSLTKNEGKTSYEVELDTEALQLKTFTDVQAFLLFDDDMVQESDDDAFEVGEDMEEDTQADEEEHQSPPPNTDKSKPFDQKSQESESDSSPDLKKFDNILPLTERQLVKYLRKAAIEGYYEENIDRREQTNKVIDAAMNSLDKNIIARGDLLNALGLKSSVASLQVTTTSQDKHLAELAKSLTSIAWNLGSRITVIELSQFTIKTKVSSLKQDTLKYQIHDDRDLLADIEHVAIEEEPTNAVSITTVKPTEMITLEIKKAAKEAKMFEMTKTEVIKVVQEEAKKIGLDPKKIISAKKAKRAIKLRKKRVEQYIWTMSNRLKPEPITDVKIYPKTKPVVITVYRNNDKRNFDVHNPFKFTYFGITELDELGPIIEKKKNTIVKDLMESLRRMRKHMELEPGFKVPRLECNISLPNGVPFINNMVIEEPEYENAKFGLKLNKLIAEHPDQEKLKSKKAYSPTAPEIESEPFKNPLETEKPQPLSPTSAPPSPDYTPTTPHTDDELKSFETSETRVSSSPSPTLPVDPTSPPSL